ncbi:hypothetical protein M413DRAFT_9280 [Hebeloma cylindrosporum]|uniref:Uncharacterized protein n=1 Tax=Hebeloma cylindrosporum TaxID=76867 RepID=A0A0C3CJT1_HEBCY|nr:hypothetical protein M413DRAFT_9280 [Hebeloma cylindrosporum h7]
MDASFTFPRPQAPVPRPAPASKASGGTHMTRESNALRASVLDAALELGLVSNPLVADWMFDNSLPEEDEEQDQVASPGLTYGSSAASEESSSSALTPSSSTHSSASSRHPHAFGAGAQFSVDSVSTTTRKNGAIQFVEPEIRGSSQDTGISGSSNPVVPFPEHPIPARPTTPGGTRKLKKKTRGDGYESDGGYMSETGKKKEKKSKKEKKKDEESIVAIESEKDAKKRAAKEEKKEQEEERKRKKSLLAAVKASKKAESKEAAEHVNGGYDTDGGVIASKGKSFGRSKTKKSKSKAEAAEGVGYETDGAGYQSSASVGVKKSKSRFFNKLSGKSSRTDLRADVEPVPALPPAHEMEPVPLPIAERFATSLSPAAVSTSSLSETRPTPSPVPPLPSSHVLGLPPPLPPLNFQSFTSEPPTSSARALAAAQASSPTNRSSHSSAESSSSSGSKRYGAQFSPTRDNGSAHGHGIGSGSFSTITSSSHQHSVQHHSPNTPNSLAHSDHTALKPPSIAYPNTRSPSPSPSTTTSSSIPTSHPPVAPLQITKGLRMKPSWENFLPSSKKAGSSTSPVSPASPFVAGNLPRSTTTSPALVHPPSHLPPSPNPMSAYLPRSRRNSSTPSPLPVISPPNTAISEQSQRPTHLTITPSSDYLVPSPRNSNLPSPNVLAYYDIPPPSPPPMGPLPNVPAGRPGSANGNANVLPSPAALRQRFIDRTPRHLPSDLHPVVHPPSNIQRGREQPFPSRPVVPVPSASPGIGGSVAGLARRYGNMPPPSGPPAGGGGSAPADVYASSRYQEEKDRAYARRGLTEPAPKFTTQPRHWIDDDREDADSVDDNDNDSANVELRDVLDRFDDGSAESAESHYEEPGHALGRSHSIEAMKGNHHESFPVSEYYGARARIPRASSSNGHGGDEYQFDDGRTVGDRMSRWSGSIYSRASILDEDESGETRDRLVKRMKRNGGAGGRGYVPPVPRLPDAYATGNAEFQITTVGGIQLGIFDGWKIKNKEGSKEINSEEKEEESKKKSKKGRKKEKKTINNI